MDSESARQLSWRDPAGFVLRQGDRILRAVSKRHAGEAKKLLNSTWYTKLAADGVFPPSYWLESDPQGVTNASEWTWVEHKPFGFPCYPHEITALQLYDAAKLTLRIAREALRNGWLLKDASAWNVLFDNGRPVFCDVLSFEATDSTGVWRAYAQYCRHFVIPLLLHKHLAVQPADLFLIHRDGVPPEKARPMLRGLAAYLQPALETVTMPSALHRHWLAKGEPARIKSVSRRDPQLAAHLFKRTLTRLEKHIDSLEPAAGGYQTTWANYEHRRSHYADTDLSVKHEFVDKALAHCQASTVLDLGCNAGEFSIGAASAGKRVLAADSDYGALTKLYARVRRSGLNITPVTLDLGRPTPSVGWMNKEIPSFLDRARGKFDCVMALGLIHHLLVTERASLPMILELISALDARALIIEWIDPQDERFRQIACLNRALYEHLNSQCFENLFSDRFKLISKQELVGGTRVLYHWENIKHRAPEPTQALVPHL